MERTLGNPQGPPSLEFSATSEENETRDGKEEHGQVREPQSQHALPHHTAPTASPGCPVYLK